jgi:type VI secretion system secreted protein Hcp
MKRSLFIILLALGVGTGSIHAAHVDYFLKLDGIDGESTDDRHKGQIEILSFSWTVVRPSAAGSPTGTVTFFDAQFGMHASKATPKLFLACATGQHIPSATFVIHRPDGDTNVYYRVEMKDIMVTSYQTGGSAHGDVVPTDQISVNFAQIKFEHIGADGTVTSAEAIRPTITQ